jgi:hypothetical protein
MAIHVKVDGTITVDTDEEAFRYLEIAELELVASAAGDVIYRLQKVMYPRGYSYILQGCGRGTDQVAPEPPA